MPGRSCTSRSPRMTPEGREFWGAFGWQFESYPGPSEYHMTRIADTQGAAVTNMDPARRAPATTSTWRNQRRRRTRPGARRRGGDPMPVPSMGWFVICTDPHGNEFGLWQTDPSAPRPDRRARPRQAASPPGRRRPLSRPDLRRRAARSSAAISIFFISSIACMTRWTSPRRNRRAARSGSRDDLPRHAEPVLQPAAGPSSPPSVSALQNRSTSLLGLAGHLERDRLVESEVRAAVQGEELLPVQFEVTS